MDKQNRKHLKRLAGQTMEEREAASRTPPDLTFLNSIATPAAVNAFLLAFETLNTAPNHIPAFHLQQLSPAADPRSAVEQHLQPNENYAVRLEPLDDWQPALAIELPLWFFPHLPITNPHTRQQTIQTFINLLDRALHPITTVWKVHLDSTDAGGLTPWYEAAWADYLFQSDRTLHFLHLGVSD
jgi:hypothetical protein